MISTEDDNRLYTLVHAARETLDGMWLTDPDRSSMFSGALKATWIMYRRAATEPRIQHFLYEELSEFVHDILTLEQDEQEDEEIDYSVDFTLPEPANTNRYFCDPLPDAAEDDQDDDAADDTGTLRRTHPWREGISV